MNSGSIRKTVLGGAAAFLMMCAGCSPADQKPTETGGNVRPAPVQRIVFAAEPGGKAFAAKVGNWRLLLFEPDDKKQPTAWQGPLRIHNQARGASCEAQVSLVTAVYGAAGAGTLIVVSYSGSLTYVHFLDGSSCKESSPTITAHTEGVQVVGDRLTVQPGCECPGQKKPCTCSAARVYVLDANLHPTLQEKESLELTRQTLGVAFVGTEKILDPKTPKARITRE